MRAGRCLRIVGLFVALGAAVPAPLAAPPTKAPLSSWATPAPMPWPALREALEEGLTQIFPADALQQGRVQFLPLRGNEYVVSHPALYWRVEEEPAAEAVAEELAGIAPGWGTAVLNGPRGYGVYLTYQHSS